MCHVNRKVSSFERLWLRVVEKLSLFDIVASG
jgi:hypothetical protein